jgi:hypothetical protein
LQKGRSKKDKTFQKAKVILQDNPGLQTRLFERNEF